MLIPALPSETPFDVAAFTPRTASEKPKLASRRANDHLAARPFDSFDSSRYVTSTAFISSKLSSS